MEDTQLGQHVDTGLAQYEHGGLGQQNQQKNIGLGQYGDTGVGQDENTWLEQHLDTELGQNQDLRQVWDEIVFLDQDPGLGLSWDTVMVGAGSPS